jgi:D-alanyl-D-alanine carboxypeptidase
MMKHEVLMAVALLMVFMLPRQAAADALSDKTDRYVKEVMAGLHIPGLALAVVRDGKVIKTGAYGLACVEHEAVVKPETVFLLASVTKQFTAASILMLVEEGKAALDERISRYLSETPDSWRDITVRHLLTHTAGLKDRFEVLNGAPWQLAFTTEAMYNTARACPVDFKPGERFQYSDQGYFLLGMIIEKLSGKSYREFLAERIFKPLWMSASSTTLQTDVVKNLASGYTLAGGNLQHNHRRTDYGLVSHFGIISTVLDLAKWDAALYGGKLLKKSSIDLMFTAGKLENGDPAQIGPWSYGLGWFVDDFFGHRIVQHGGSTGTCIWRLPDDKTTVIVLTNLEQLAGGDAPTIAKTIARLYVPAVTWKAVKAQTDPDPALTEKLKAEISRMASGKPDTALYSAQFSAAVVAASQSSVGFYKSIGALKTFEYLGSRPAGSLRHITFRAAYPGATLYYTVTLDAHGRIAYLGGELEENL